MSDKTFITLEVSSIIKKYISSRLSYQVGLSSRRFIVQFHLNIDCSYVSSLTNYLDMTSLASSGAICVIDPYVVGSSTLQLSYVKERRLYSVIIDKVSRLDVRPL